MSVLASIVDRVLDPEARHQPAPLASEPEHTGPVPPDEGDSGTSAIPSGKDDA